MNGQLALITPLTGSGDRPDNSLPGGPPMRPSHPITLPPVPPGFPPIPDHTLPGGAHPSNPIFLPFPGRPDNSLPGSGGRPDNSLPGSGGRPDRPDNSLPGSGGSIDNSLPGSGGSIDNTLPMPPGTIWPPLNPGDGVFGKGLLLILVIGADGVEKFKWVVVDAPVAGYPLPPHPEPK
jgi:hypothetical protein